MNIKQIRINNMAYKIKDSNKRSQISQDFITTKQYKIGDYCLYNNNLYRCIQDTAGVWNNSNWEKIFLTNEIKGTNGVTVGTIDEWEIMETIIDKTYTGETIPAIITDKIFRIKNGCFNKNSFLTIASFLNCSIIGSSAFRDCTSLVSVSFPDCSIIGNYVFYSCSSLVSVSFPNCSTIGIQAFGYCISLASVSFSSCTMISNYAFNNCKSLASVYLLGSTLCTLSNSNAFTNTPIANSSYLGHYGSIYVPTSLLNSYKIATNWATIADRIVGI